MFVFDIKPLSKMYYKELQQKIDNKTKPLGALGNLEPIALKIGLIQNRLDPELKQPTIVVFAADHGAYEAGISSFPQEVTAQMVFNFLKGGAAINVFCEQNGIAIKVVDAGVKADFEHAPNLIHAKIAKGTQNYLARPAMTPEQCLRAIKHGADIVSAIFKDGTNVIGFGEMGIGNTSSASLLMSLFCNLPIEACVGRGAGQDEQGFLRKKKVLTQALKVHQLDGTPLAILSTFGGFEIAMMTGAMLKAAELQMLVLIDGFIATAALLAARAFEPALLEYCLFTHCSDEGGHRHMLNFLKVEPLIQLNMRLGEGTGAAVAYPLIQAAVGFLNKMTSFEDANVSKNRE